MAKLVNLTSHDVVIANDAGAEILRIPPSGIIARIDVRQDVIGHVESDGVTIPVVATVFGELTGLPEPEQDVVYIASTLVAQRAAQLGRKDVVSPDTGPTAVRDDAGRIVAVRRFQAFWA